MSFRDQKSHRRNKELKRRYRKKEDVAAIWGNVEIKEIQMSIELKIKIKNLADEARTIRQEEAKLHGMEKWKLQHHRKTVVRNAARRTQIAYQIIRGRDWASCTSHAELTRYTDWSEISRMVKKYGTPEAIESLAATEKQFKLFSRSGDDENAENACSNAA